MAIKDRIKNPFGKYKDVHKDESVILYGSGPSIQKFNTKKNVLKIGMNEQIYLNLNLDYWFMGDTRYKQPEKFVNCKKDYYEYQPKITKFVRWQIWTKWGRMPYNMPHSTYYVAKLFRDKTRCGFTKNIDKEIMPTFKSITDEALQFALFTGVKRIYLVGHDCDYSSGTFRTGRHAESANEEEELLLLYWGHIKEWVKENYPDVEIYSINPVALRIFEEVSEKDIIENE